MNYHPMFWKSMHVAQKILWKGEQKARNTHVLLGTAYASSLKSAEWFMIQAVLETKFLVACNSEL